MPQMELLKKLLNMEEPVDTLITQLEKFGWDSNVELVILERKHLFKILQNYIQGRIAESEVEDWANAIECREDIGREISAKNLIEQILYELANPTLQSNLSKDRAKKLCKELLK